MDSNIDIRIISEGGKIVLPSSARKKLNISYRCPVEIFVEGDTIVVKKLNVSTVSNCIFCGNTDELIDFHSFKVCRNCVKTIKRKKNSK